MITTVGVKVEVALDDIRMKARKVVIHIECDSEAYLINFLGQIWPIQSVDQWANWITNTELGEEVPQIDWLI